MARKFQIGVMGSAADLKYSKEVEKAAYEVGRLIAEEDGILFLEPKKIAILCQRRHVAVQKILAG